MPPTLRPRYDVRVVPSGWLGLPLLDSLAATDSLAAPLARRWISLAGDRPSDCDVRSACDTRQATPQWPTLLHTAVAPSSQARLVSRPVGTGRLIVLRPTDWSSSGRLKK